MYSKDDYKVLELRNETSLYLDDLVALVINSVLANQLREFSGEVMALTPGFTFNYRQAKNLKELTIRKYKQYKAGTITDVDLMNYQTEANAILRGDEVEIGGSQVGIFDKLLHGKEIKKKEALNRLEQDFRNVMQEIEDCQEKMKRCIAASKGHSPDSAIYRNNERTWRAANNELTLLNQQASMLLKTLGEADRVRIIEKHKDQLKRMNENTVTALGNEQDLIRLQTEAEMESERSKATSTRYENFGASIFEMAVEDQEIRADSEFGAQVAAEERRQTILDFAGVVAEETEVQETAADDAFAAQVKEKGIE